MIKSHLSPLLDRGDFVKVFLNERQHLPAKAAAASAVGRAGLNASSRRSSRKASPKVNSVLISMPRMATLAILGMCNAASSWYRKENAPVARIDAEFTRLVIDGVGKRPATRRRKR